MDELYMGMFMKKIAEDLEALGLLYLDITKEASYLIEEALASEDEEE